MNYVAPPQSQSATYQYGFTVRRTFAIEVRNPNLAGRVIDAAASAGTTNIDSVSFGLQNNAAALSRALELAVENATNQAAALARDAHVRVVGVESIETGAPSYPIPRPLTAAHVQGDIYSTTLDSGSTTVSQTVTMVFLAKP